MGRRGGGGGVLSIYMTRQTWKQEGCDKNVVFIHTQECKEKLNILPHADWHQLSTPAIIPITIAGGTSLTGQLSFISQTMSSTLNATKLSVTKYSK